MKTAEEQLRTWQDATQDALERARVAEDRVKELEAELALWKASNETVHFPLGPYTPHTPIWVVPRTSPFTFTSDHICLAEDSSGRCSFCDKLLHITTTSG